MEENPDLYRLEGSNDGEIGGLIVSKKKSADHVFKKPHQAQPSVLGLDKLAEQKRRENSQERAMQNHPPEAHNSFKDRRYRTRKEETPTHTGGVDKATKDRLDARVKRQTLDKYARERDRDRRDMDRHRDRDRDRDRYRDRNRAGGSARDSSSRRDRTPRFRDAPETPVFGIKVMKYLLIQRCIYSYCLDNLYRFVYSYC